MSNPTPRRRLQFSLRSLILLVVLISSGTGLWHKWEPWAFLRNLDVPDEHAPNRVLISADETRLLTLGLEYQNSFLLNSQTGKSIATYPMPLAARFSENGQEFTMVHQHAIRIFEAKSGKLLKSHVGHIDFLTCAVFSADGKRVATSEGVATYVWDAATGEALATVPLEGDNSHQVAFSPHDELLAVWGAHSLRILNGATYAPVSELNIEKQICLGFSPTGDLILSDSKDNTVYHTNLDESKRGLLLKGLDHMATSADYSSDGRQIVTLSNDRTITLWDVGTSTPRHILADFDEPLESMILTDNGERLLTLSNDGLLNVWNTKTGALLIETRLHAKGDWIHARALSEDRVFLATGHMTTNQASIRLISTSTGRTIISRDVPDPIEFAAFSPDGQKIVTAENYANGAIRSVSVRDTKSLKPVTRLGEKDWANISEVLLSPSGRYALVLAHNPCRLIDLEQGVTIPIGKSYLQGSTVAAFSPGEDRLITQFLDLFGKRADLILWSTNPLKKIRLSTLKGEVEILDQLLFTPDGSFIIGLRNPSGISLWDGKDGSLIRHFGIGKAIHHLVDASNEPSITTFMTTIAAERVISSPNGKELIVSSYEDLAHEVWDLQDFRLRGTIALSAIDTHSAKAIAYSSDGKRLLLLGLKNEIKERDSISAGPITISILDAQSLARLAAIRPKFDTYFIANSPSGRFWVFNREIWHRRRPEQWWGVTWLPEFWLTVVLGVGLVWSVWRDWTRLARR